MIANSYGIKQYKNPVVSEYQGKTVIEGAEHIAIHYRFVIDHVFTNHGCDYFIIVEDDMIFAPDVLLYFSQVAPLMDKDQTIYSISAYNDNGFKGRVKNVNMVYRTDFFIGLGWLVSKRLWNDEWSKSWPRTHWDHFLRNPMNRRDRQTLYPEISRIYHSGYKGTHSTVALYEKYFRDIQLNMKGYVPMGVDTEAFKMGKYKFSNLEIEDDKTVDFLLDAEYKKFFTAQINPSSKNVVYLDNVDDIKKHENKRIVLAYEGGTALINRNWAFVSEYFDVWHTVPVRAEYLGVTQFRYMTNVIYMMATYSEYYDKFETYFEKPKPALVPFEQFSINEPAWVAPKTPSVLSISVAKQGQSCSGLCLEKFGESSKCDLFKIGELNTCRNLKKYFTCEECGGNIGHDQPALDVDEKKCLFNTGSRQYMTTCEGAHPKTQRLCACFDPKTVKSFHEEWEVMIAKAQKQAKNPNSE